MSNLDGTVNKLTQILNFLNKIAAASNSLKDILLFKDVLTLNNCNLMNSTNNSNIENAANYSNL